MNFLGRLLFLAAAVVAIGVALWLSLTLFGVLLIGGGIAAILFAGRQALIDKGILNPRPGVPPEAEGTLIEGEFEEIENPMVDQEKKH